jgi:hypothetical protein
MTILKRIDLGERLNLELLREGLSRRSAYVWIGLLAVALLTFMAVTSSIASKRERRLVQRQAELDGFYEMVSEYKRDMASIGYLREKLQLQGVEGSTGTVIEEIGAAIGLEKQITSFKPLAEDLVNGYMEKGVQVEIEGVTLNQAVNLLYKIKGYKNLLLIRDFSMKSHFQNPDMLDITVQVILITKPAGIL